MRIGKVKLDKPETMWALVGESGEYDFHVEWVVGLFHSKEKAEEYQKMLEDNAISLGVPNALEEIAYGNIPEGLIDLDFVRCWTGFGFQYYISEAKVLDA